MAKRKTSNEAKRRYAAKAYARLGIFIPKGRKQALDEYVRKHETSVNGLVNELLREKLGMTKEEWKHADWKDQPVQEDEMETNPAWEHRWSGMEDVSNAFREGRDGEK